MKLFTIIDPNGEYIFINPDHISSIVDKTIYINNLGETLDDEDTDYITLITMSNGNQFSASEHYADLIGRLEKGQYKM